MYLLYHIFLKIQEKNEIKAKSPDSNRQGINYFYQLLIV